MCGRVGPRRPSATEVSKINAKKPKCDKGIPKSVARPRGGCAEAPKRDRVVPKSMVKRQTAIGVSQNRYPSAIGVAPSSAAKRQSAIGVVEINVQSARRWRRGAKARQGCSKTNAKARNRERGMPKSMVRVRVGYFGGSLRAQIWGS